MELLNNNNAILSGKIVSEYKYYHSTLGEDFFIVDVEAKRKSGEVDILPVVVSEKLLENGVKEAEFIKFSGQIRTYNKDDGRVEIYLFARDTEVSDENTFVNQVKLKGFLCKKGKYRTTFTKRKVLDFIVAVNRAYYKSDYIPVISWGTDAKYVNSKDVSTEFEITGRFQSRKFIKKDIDGNKEEKIAFEISASQVVISDK